MSKYKSQGDFERNEEGHTPMDEIKPFSPDSRDFTPKEALMQQQIRANAQNTNDLGVVSARKSMGSQYGNLLLPSFSKSHIQGSKSKSLLLCN
jgi:hypothetical protein